MKWPGTMAAVGFDDGCAPDLHQSGFTLSPAQCHGMRALVHQMWEVCLLEIGSSYLESNTHSVPRSNDMLKEMLRRLKSDPTHVHHQTRQKPSHKSFDVMIAFRNEHGDVLTHLVREQRATFRRFPCRVQRLSGRNPFSSRYVNIDNPGDEEDEEIDELEFERRYWLRPFQPHDLTKSYERWLSSDEDMLWQAHVRGPAFGEYLDSPGR